MNPNLEYLATTAAVDAIDATDNPDNPYQPVAKNLKRRMEWILKLGLRFMFCAIAYVVIYTVIQVEAPPEFATWAREIGFPFLARWLVFSGVPLLFIWFLVKLYKLGRFAFSRKSL